MTKTKTTAAKTAPANATPAAGTTAAPASAAASTSAASTANPAAKLLKRAAKVKLCCFDVDGTLTDGRLWFDPEGKETKAFHVHDGLGLRLLEDSGIAIALVTARNSPSAVARGRDLGLKHVFTGVKDKLACVKHLCKTLDLKLDQVAFFGDDLPDLRALAAVGLAAAPANAHDWVKPHVHWVSPLNGGEGAARSFCDLIIEAQGMKDKIVAGFMP